MDIFIVLLVLFFVWKIKFVSINEEYLYSNYFLTKEVCVQVLSDMNARKRFELQREEIDLDNETTTAYNSMEVPFKEEGGVKIVHVKVNGVGGDMIFDKGCSGTLLSLSEVRYLASKGLLLQEDILGTTHSQIADGSIVENMVVNLRKVSIITNDGGTIDCYNVKATVSNNINAPLLQCIHILYK